MLIANRDICDQWESFFIDRIQREGPFDIRAIARFGRVVGGLQILWSAEFLKLPKREQILASDLAKTEQETTKAEQILLGNLDLWKANFHLLSEDDAFFAIPECTAKSLDFCFCIPNSCVQLRTKGGVKQLGGGHQGQTCERHQADSHGGTPVIDQMTSMMGATRGEVYRRRVTLCGFGSSAPKI